MHTRLEIHTTHIGSDRDTIHPRSEITQHIPDKKYTQYIPDQKYTQYIPDQKYTQRIPDQKYDNTYQIRNRHNTYQIGNSAMHTRSEKDVPWSSSYAIHIHNFLAVNKQPKFEEMKVMNKLDYKTCVLHDNVAV